MTMHKASHPRDDVDRLYVSRKGWRELASIQDSADASIQRLEDYIKKHGGKLIPATRNTTDNTSINWNQNWEETLLYGYLKPQTSEISHEKTWS